MKLRLATEDRWPDGEVIYDHDFRDGNFGGWQDHMSGNAAQHTLTMNTDQSLSGHALMLPTGPRPNASSIPSSNCSALLRLSLVNRLQVGAPSVVSVDFWWAVIAEQLAINPASIEFGIDKQDWDNAAESRAFPKLRYAYWDNTGSPQLNARQWRIVNDAGGLVDIPGGQIDHGINENKGNFFKATLTMDLNGAGGVGSYLEARIQEKAFDLSRLGAGRGRQAPQVPPASTSFAGGFNLFAAVSNRNNGDATTPTPGCAALLLGRVRATVRSTL